ncbi:polysaccharide lyase family 7 protein [Pseudocolwellia sp. AS88]|uniref:polysaccharide lyase family 7 protein n=1 Tax=Pseudocolwellia sp. AS88 TaxID=3063958 RepID=UPI0026F1BB45|nr:polysaccharide lyase family 7 protein [Pseudocolwellia sp. AS88]MDO7084813.1 polysaccharide lyase family 7 protein [Pseudocolwellia sp. AS88]
MFNKKSLILLTTLSATSCLTQAATINNAGFESGWSSWDETDPASISGNAYQGSSSLKISGSPGRVFQLVNVEKNTEYTLSAYVKGKGLIGINDLNGLFKNQKFDESNWTKISRTFTNGNQTSLQVFAKHDNSSSDVRFDNFELVATNDSSGGGSSSGATIPSIITNGNLFDLEGDDPHPLVNSSTLVFVPLEAQHTTSNGGGWRHEYKIKPSERKAMHDTQESFSANYKVEMSDGGKTIVAQHHGSDTSTLMKVYIADSNEGNLIDSVASNGIFDVYVRMLGEGDSSETVFPLGTIRSGESFDLTMTNDDGRVRVTGLGQVADLTVKDDSSAYFKFGNYIQSQYPAGDRDDCGTRGDSESFADCFDEIGITTSKITLTDVSYSSNH